MRGLVAVVCVMLCAQSVGAALVSSRAVSPRSPAFDPLAPTFLYWHANPATIMLRPSTLALGHARPYNLSELQANLAGTVVHVSAFGVALGLTTLGSDTYRESDATATLGLRLGRALSVAATAHQVELRFGDRFAAQRFPLADVGVWLQTPDGSGLGLSACDLGAPEIGDRPALDARYRAALVYRHSPGLALRAGAEFRGHWGFAFGETLLIGRALHLHAELQSRPLRLTVGTRLTLGHLWVDFIYRDHPELGGDQAWGIGWTL
jgi:hypothetical protein